MDRCIVIITTTAARKDAEAIARLLVEWSLAACVQIDGPVTSTYRWKGNTITEEEYRCVIKSTEKRYPAVEAAICSIHPYEIPEIVALPIEQGSEAYLNWLREQVQPAAEK